MIQKSGILLFLFIFIITGLTTNASEAKKTVKKSPPENAAAAKKIAKVPVTDLKTDELYMFRNFSVTLEKYPKDRSTITVINMNQDRKCTYRTFKTVKGKHYLRENLGFNLSQRQLELIYYEILRNRFLTLKPVIGNPKTYQGTVVKLSIRIDYVTKSVTLYGHDETMDDILDGILYTIPYDYAYRFDSAEWYY